MPLVQDNNFRKPHLLYYNLVYFRQHKFEKFHKNQNNRNEDIWMNVDICLTIYIKNEGE